MKYLDEYRDAQAARKLAAAIARTVTRPWTIMEVCGGQTHTIVKYGIDQVLPPGIDLVHGPGPVCTGKGSPDDAPLARRYRVPIVITGFEPIDMLEGVLRTVLQLEAGRADVENQYGRVVRREGNPEARKLIEDVFEVCDRK